MRIKRSSVRRAGQRKREAGQALVELALVAPVLLALVLGVADFCRAFYASIAVTNAARAGAQYAYAQGYTSGSFADIQAAAVNDAGLREFNASNVVATYYCECPGIATQYPLCKNGGTVLSCTGGVAPEIWTDVSTSYRFTTIVNYPGIPHSTTLSGRAQMRLQ